MKKQERNDDLAAYYAHGYSMRETAKQFEVSLERVRQILRDHYPDLIRRAHVGMSMTPHDRQRLR